jgi:tetratricopeptide (TPR) repeat protein
VTTESMPDLAQRCTSCETLNQPNARVCAGCGVNLAELLAAGPRLRQLRRGRTTTTLEALEHEAANSVATEVARGRRRLGLQLGLLLGAALLLLGLIAVASLLAANYARARQERLAADNRRATVCLEAGDYRCARDGFAALLSEDAEYPRAQDRLNTARYLLAQQYAAAGQWQAALDELEALLKAAPGDRPALSLTKSVYDRWLADAESRGDWWTAARLRIQRDLRFPPEVKEQRGDVL